MYILRSKCVMPETCEIMEIDKDCISVQEHSVHKIIFEPCKLSGLLRKGPTAKNDPLYDYAEIS